MSSGPPPHWISSNPFSTAAAPPPNAPRGNRPSAVPFSFAGALQPSTAQPSAPSTSFFGGGGASSTVQPSAPSRSLFGNAVPNTTWTSSPPGALFGGGPASSTGRRTSEQAPSASKSVASNASPAARAISTVSSRALDNLRNSARGYLNDKRFTDFKIICQDKEFDVHRVYVVPHSKWFESCCAGSFAEGIERKTELKDDSLQAVEAMITFLYTFDYDDTPAAAAGVGGSISQPTTEKGVEASAPGGKEICEEIGEEVVDRTCTTALEVNAWVYATADKYQVPILKDLALEKMKARLKELHTDAKAMSSAVRMVYSVMPCAPSDQTLHNLLLDAWLMGGLALHQAAQTDHGCRDLIDQAPQFSRDLSGRLMGSFPSGFSGASVTVRTYCPKCKHWADTTKEALLAGSNSSCPEHGTFAPNDFGFLPTVKAKKFW